MAATQHELQSVKNVFFLDILMIHKKHMKPIAMQQNNINLNT